MSECNGEMQIQHTKDIAILQNEVKNLKITVADFSTIKETLVELTLLNKQEIEFNKNQVRSNEKFGNTLLIINENLTSLNGRVKILEITKEDQEEQGIKQDIKDERAIEDNVQLKADKYKSKWLFYGVLAAGFLSFLSVLVPILMKD